MIETSTDYQYKSSDKENLPLGVSSLETSLKIVFATFILGFILNFLQLGIITGALKVGVFFFLLITVYQTMKLKHVPASSNGLVGIALIWFVNVIDLISTIISAIIILPDPDSISLNTASIRSFLNQYNQLMLIQLSLGIVGSVLLIVGAYLFTLWFNQLISPYSTKKVNTLIYATVIIGVGFLLLISPLTQLSGLLQQLAINPTSVTLSDINGVLTSLTISSLIIVVGVILQIIAFYQFWKRIEQYNKPSYRTYG